MRCSDGTAACGVPAKTSLIGLQPFTGDAMRALFDDRFVLTEPFGLPNHLHGFPSLLRIESIDEKNAVEVIGLVLDGTGQ